MIYIDFGENMKKLIVLEGTDGSGKKTQAELLATHLKSIGKTVVTQSFPNYDSESAGPVKMYLGGKLCENANELSAEQSSVLFTVDRLCTMQQLDKNDADIGVFDRYVESNLIHQGSKIRDRRRLKKYVKWLYCLEYGTLKLHRPDVVVFLNMPPVKSIELAHARAKNKSGLSNDIHEKDEQHLKAAYDTGMFLAKKLGWKIVDCVDGFGNIKTKEEIAQEVLKKIEPVL